MLLNIIFPDVAKNYGNNDGSALLKNAKASQEECQPGCMSIVMHRGNQCQANCPDRATHRMHWRPHHEHIRQKTHNQRSYYAPNTAQRGYIAGLVFRVAQFVLKVGRNPIVNAIVGKLDEEKGEGVSENPRDAKRSAK